MKPLFKVRFWEILPKTPFLVYRIYSLFKHCETNCSWLALNMLHWPGFFALLASSTRNISCLCWSLYTPNFISYMLALSFNLEFRSLLGPAPILSAFHKYHFLHLRFYLNIRFWKMHPWYGLQVSSCDLQLCYNFFPIWSCLISITYLP